MNRVIKYLTIVIFSATLLWGCDESFLELSNPNEIDAEVLFTDVDNLSLELTSVYSSLKSYRLYGAGFMAQSLLPKGFIADQDWTGNADWNHMFQHESVAEDNSIADIWLGWYRVVARANDFFTQADDFIAEKDPSADDLATIEQMKGEAYFLRAFAYFHLVRLWGEGNPAVDGDKPGVPLILQVSTSIEEMKAGRASVNEVYTQIISDLTNAINKLPETWDADNIARADSWSAKGLLSRVYMTQHDFTNAKSTLEDIINNGSFSLVPGDEYEGLFHDEKEFSEESLFEINLATDMTVNSFNGGLGSLHALLIAPYSKGWSNIFVHDENVRRFGSDPRLHVNALEPGVDTIYNGTFVVKQYPKGELGWNLKKYINLEESIYSTNRNYGANFNIVRLADIYLMYAEVLNEQGSDATASEYMNKVRRRAYGYDPNTAVPEVDYTGFTGTQLRDSIREERFRELFAEGMRWYDIQRWRIGAEEAARYKKVVSGTIVFDDIDYYLPIPQTEMTNNEVIQQSTGY